MRGRRIGNGGLQPDRGLEPGFLHRYTLTILPPSYGRESVLILFFLLLERPGLRPPHWAEHAYHGTFSPPSEHLEPGA